MLIEVSLEAINEVIATNVGEELLEYGCALSVRNHVEVRVDCFQIDHVGSNRVSSGKLILTVSSSFTGGVEVGPTICKVGTLIECEI